MESSKRTTELNAINRLVNAICDANSAKRSKNYIRILRALKDHVLTNNTLYEDTLSTYNELIPYLGSKSRKELVNCLQADEQEHNTDYLYKECLVKIAADAVTGKKGAAASTYSDLIARTKEILMADAQKSLVIKNEKSHKKEIA